MSGRPGTGWGLLLLAALLLAGCGRALPGSAPGEIEFAEIFEGRVDALKIEKTIELDVDGDGQKEWFVAYRYDPTERNEWENTPIQAIVYDALPCNPPRIANWTLPFPDNDYLGEGESVRATMVDLLADGTVEGQRQDELVIEGEGPVNTLSIFRFRDGEKQACDPLVGEGQGFDLVGFFRASGPIRLDAEAGSVTLFERAAFERSQLAIRSTFRPRLGSRGESFLSADGQRVGPAEQSVDFLYGMPRSPLDSPYPEKAVATFYLSLGQNNERAKSYLTSDLAAQFDTRLWGLDVPVERVDHVIIYSLAYHPDRAAEAAHADRRVTLTVAAVDRDGNRGPAREITWRLIGIPIPDEQRSEWRLAEMEGVVVTEGLGMLPAPLREVTTGARGF